MIGVAGSWVPNCHGSGASKNETKRNKNLFIKNRDGGIRTHGTNFVLQFSKLTL